MAFIGLVLSVNFISVVLACFPSINHDQNSFCRSDYAFTGFVLRSSETNRESVFQIQLTSNLKGRVAIPGQLLTIYGRGSGNSCGPHRLNRFQGHVLYVSSRSFPDEPARLEITEHHTFDPVNVNRVANYDCSCEIVINLPQQPNNVDTTPAGDKCVITENEYDCNFRQGFCSRQQSPFGAGRCSWIAPTIPCPQR
uniref:Uncharacterized protein LOC111108975 n=1 Tax=Crassostrea virginica TaxID=6565 RepID=A0A8B8BCR8_CRAVI|nr:uncharacterized protein LOC111108975 [Crassostrea virginica]